MKFNSSLFRISESKNRVRDLIITFLQRGGFETQVNVSTSKRSKPRERTRKNIGI